MKSLPAIVAGAVLAALAVISLPVGCTVHDPLYCDPQTPCTDPERPFCDLEGIYPGSDGHGRSCVPNPFDAMVGVDAAVDGAVADSPPEDGPLPSYLLTVTASAGGAVSGPGIACGGDCTESFPAGSTVMLLATPDAGMVFTGWAGACTGAVGSVCSVEMTADQSAAASFVPSGSLLWLRQLGGTQPDTSYGVAQDSSGNVYVAGSFTTMMTIGGATLLGFGADDVFCGKFSPAGTLIWAKAFGGTGTDVALGVTADSTGNVVIVGSFSQQINFGGGALTSLGSSDIFVAKLSAATGDHVLSLRFGSVQLDDVKAVALSSTDEIFIAGRYDGTINFGGSALPSAGADDVFLVKLSAAGAHLWSQRFGGALGDVANDLTVDSAGSVIMAGRFLGAVDFGGGSLMSAGGSDIFVAKYSSTGSHLWSHAYGAASADEAHSVSADASDAVHVAGKFVGSVNFGGGALMSAGSDDAFLLKLSAGGSYSWAQRFGGANADAAYSVSAAVGGDVVVAGSFQLTVDFGGGGLTSAGLSDAFVARLGSGGAHVWSRRFGGASNDVAYGAGAQSDDGVVVSGSFSGTADFAGMALSTFGSNDGFLVKSAP